MSLLLGIDLGTSYFKVGLFEADGQMRALVRVPVPKHAPGPDRSELPVEEFWRALRTGTTDALREANAAPGNIAGISYSSQASSFVLLDRRAEPLTPIVLWTDGRGAPVEPALTEFASTAEFQRRVGFAGLSGFAAPTKWRWFQSQAPHIWDATARIMTISDYFTFALTGRAVGDASTAAFLGIYDLSLAAWWPDALCAFAIDPAKLSRPLRPGAAAGSTTESACEKLGVPPGIPFAVGALDHHAAAIGSGLGTIADVSISTGTVLAALVLVGRVEAIAGCYHGPHVDGRRFYRLAFDPDGAAQLEDYQRTHASEHSIEQLLALAASASSDGARHGVAVRRILERASTTHRRLVTDVLAGGRTDRIVATGGGARSPLWLQINADTLGASIVTPACPERACLGAAAFASVAAGFHPTLDVAAQHMIRPGAIYRPKGMP